MLVARSEQKLTALAQELSSTYGIQTEVLAVDLTVAGAASQLVATLHEGVPANQQFPKETQRSLSKEIA